MKKKLEVVDPATIDDPFTKAAQALWAMVWSMTSVNEDVPEVAGEVSPAMRRDAERFGDWQARLHKGIEALTSLYRTFYGERGGQLITEYFEARYQAPYYIDDDPRKDLLEAAERRYEDVRRALMALHDGYIVNGYDLQRETDEPASGWFS